MLYSPQYSQGAFPVCFDDQVWEMLDVSYVTPVTPEREAEIRGASPEPLMPRTPPRPPAGRSQCSPPRLRPAGAPFSSSREGLTMEAKHRSGRPARGRQLVRVVDSLNLGGTS